MKNTMINLTNTLANTNTLDNLNTICTFEYKEVKRSTNCPCCGKKLIGKKVVVYTPFQKKQKNGNGGVSVCEACFNNGAVVSNHTTDKKVSSNNTVNHKVAVVCSIIDSVYFSYYGMLKSSDVRNGMVVFSNEYNNSQSAGVVIANAIECGYIVKVEVGNDVYTITSVSDYDNLTKNVLGTRTR